MKANPGGNIDPACVYGRDQIIEQIWEQLDRQCVLLYAERRIGKTSILRKMVAQPRPGWLPNLQDLLLALNSATTTPGDRDQILRMLKLLERDHYLTRDRTGAYQFRFPLIRRWWALDRGL